MNRTGVIRLTGTFTAEDFPSPPAGMPDLKDQVHRRAPHRPRDLWWLFRVELIEQVEGQLFEDLA